MHPQCRPKGAIRGCPTYVIRATPEELLDVENVIDMAIAFRAVSLDSDGKPVYWLVIVNNGTAELFAITEEFLRQFPDWIRQRSVA